MTRSSILLLCILFIGFSESFNIHKQAQKQIQVISDDQALMGINWPFTICGQGTWTIQKVILGAAPARNTNDDIDVIGSAKDSIQFKSVNLNVKLNGVPLHSEDVAFTNSYDQGDTVEFRIKNYIPEFAPSGTYSIAFTFSDKIGKAQGCLSISFKI